MCETQRLSEKKKPDSYTHLCSPKCSIKFADYFVNFKRMTL